MRIKMLLNNVIPQPPGSLLGRGIGVLIFLMISASAYAQGEFVTIWETTSANQEIVIPTTGAGYNYTVDWGDGNTDTDQTGDATHTYASSGRHQIKITGAFPRIYMTGSSFTNRTRLKEVKQWGFNLWESMESAFAGTPDMSVTAQDSPNLALVTSMESMFEEATGLTSEDFNAWNTASVTTFKNIFKKASNFRGQIGSWNTSNVTDMSFAFEQATNFSSTIGDWDVSNVTTMEAMFRGISFNNRNRISDSRMGDWDVSSVTTMKEMFKYTNYGGDLNNWNVSKVTDMSEMFSNTFYGKNLDKWDVSSVEIMKGMFENNGRFNHLISTWNVSKVTDMSDMFKFATKFNQDISGWNTAAVTTMEDMFSGATAFDQSLAGLALTNVTTIDDMLDNSGISQANYDFTLTGWAGQTVPNGLTLGANGLEYCSSETDRQSLINDDGWTIDDDSKLCNATLTFTDIKVNEDGGAFDMTLTLDAFVDGGLTVEVSTADGSASSGTDYTALTAEVLTFVGTAGETQTISVVPTADTQEESDETINLSMANLVTNTSLNNVNISDGGTITILDDETEASLFITTWTTTTTSQEITIPTMGTGYDYQIDWGDGTVELNQTGNAAHTYTLADDYQVKIIGSFPGIHLAEGTAENAALLKSIDQWGTNEWQSMEGAFSGAVNMVMNAIDNPNLNSVTSMKEMFKDCKSFNGIIGEWNTSNIQNMEGVFDGAESFNQGIQDWSTYNVNTARRMFANAKAFNQHLEYWFSSEDRPITDLSEMFAGATSFNRNVDNWEVSTVTDLSGMFKDAEAFNRDISEWNVESVTDFSGMFSGTAGFNQNIGSWNVSAATTLVSMFEAAAVFDHDISGWNVENVTDMAAMFKNAMAFNQPLNAWNMNKVTSLAGMFEGAVLFNRPLSGWSLSVLVDINALFKGAQAFDQDLSTWTTTNVTNMREAFSGADAFNQDISGWNVANVTDMSGMFSEADAFDQNLGGWDIDMVTTMANMFDNAGLSDNNYDATLIAWSVKNVQNDVMLGAEGVKYCGSTTARQSLIDDHSWSFVGDTAGCVASVAVTDVRGNEDDGTITVILMLNEAVNGGFSVDLTTVDGTATAGADYTALAAETITFAGTAGEVQTVAINITEDTDSEDDETITINIGNLVTDAGNEVTIAENVTATIVNDDDESAFFIMTWETTTTDEEMIIPTNGGGNDYRVDWGDGLVDTHQTGDATHTYATPGVHTVKIIGAFPWIFFSEQDEDGGDLGLKLRSIEQWGTNPWQTMEGAFEGASNMVINATDAPDLSQVIRMDQMFSDCHALTNEDFSNWDVSNVQNMEELFIRANNFNGNISTWNTANVISMERMFEDAFMFQGDISSWNVSNVTIMRDMFKLTNDAEDNGDIHRFNGDITGWDVSNVVDFHGMFYSNDAFNQPIGVWDVSAAEDMEEMFFGADAINQPLNDWDVSNVTNMADMFDNADAFNQPLDQWDVSNVTDMTDMFKSTDAFNQDISTWDVSSVTDMAEMFENANAFNQDISVWDVSNVRDMEQMFRGADVFNQNISVWDVSNVTNLEGMFDGALAFDQNLGTWNMTGVNNLKDFFNESGMSQASYDATLISWAAQAIGSEELTVGADGLFYCEGSEARTFLEDEYDWSFSGDSQGCMATVTISDGATNEDDGNLFFLLELDREVIGGFSVDLTTTDGTAMAGTDYTALTNFTVNFEGLAGEQKAILIPLTADATVEADKTFTIVMSNLVIGAGNNVDITDEATGTIIDDDDPTAFFITKWTTTRDDFTVTLPTSGEGYNYRVDWGDGAVDTNVTGDTQHVYATAGEYTVTIFGAFPRIYTYSFESSPPPITSIDQWGSNPWTTMEGAFARLPFALTINATDVPNLSNVTSISEMFSDTDLGNPDLTTWDVSNVIDMTGLFSSSDFNGDITSWDVSNVTDMSGMFSSTGNFNQDISGWDVSNIISMESMFSNADAFNIDISSWDVSNVTSMKGMFQSTDLFNQPLEVWDVSNVTDMTTMFSSAKAFNQRLNGWDVSSVTKMQLMFQQADAFNQDLNDWDVSNVELFDHMFKQTDLFNGNISNWDVSSGSDFEEMFQETKAFNQPIGDWNLAKATRIRRMFQESEAFNQPLDNWRFPMLEELEQVFRKAEVFNQDLNNWDVSGITDMQDLFEEAVMFNGDVSDWDVSNVIDFSSVFNETPFNQDIRGWDVSSGEDFGSMFDEAINFNQDLSGWNMSKASNISGMFDEAATFDQDLSEWDLSNVTNFSRMVKLSGLSIENYDALLISLAAQDLVANQEFDVENLRYCAGDAARQSLINKGWDFRNDDTSCTAEVTIADISGNEDDGVIRVTLALDGRVVGGFTVDVTTAEGTAMAGTDFSGTDTQNLSFDGTAGEIKEIFISPIADIDDEEDETVLISMSNLVTGANNTVTITDEGIVTILDDDNDPPVATGTSISGLAQVGQTLTGSYSYSDDENDLESGTTFQWYTGNDAPPATIYSGTTLEDYEFQLPADQSGQNAFLNILDNAVYTQDFITGNSDDISANVDVVFGLGIGFGAYPISYYDSDVNNLDGFDSKNATKMALTSLTPTDLATIVTGEDVISLIEGDGLTLVENRVELAGGGDGVGLVIAFELTESRGSTRGLIEIASVDQSNQTLTVNIYIGSTGNQLVPISGATSTTLTLTEDLIGENVIFGVTPSNIESTGLESTSDLVGPVQGLPVISFANAAASNPESITNVSIEVTQDMAGLVPSSIDYAITGTASGGGTDYTLASGTLNFGAGDVSKNIDLTVVDDALIEEDETVIITLSNPQESSLGTQAVFSYTIANNDALVTIEDVSQFEDGESFLVTATLEGNVTGGFSVDVSTADGTATVADNDYDAVAGQTLSFSGTDGETQTFDISPGFDSKLEANETFSVYISNLAGTNATVVISDEATLTITNDDTAAITMADASGNEGDGAITLTATLDNAVQDGFTVEVSTADGTATVANSDYTAIAGQTLTFTGTVGETQIFTVIPTNDLVIESDETLTVSLSGLSTTLGVDISDVATVTITNDDFNNAPSDISLSTGSIAENNALDATIGALTTTDLDAGDTHSYSLVAGTGDIDNADFVIDGTDLKVNNASFNFEDQAIYNIRLQTDDGKGGTFSKTFTISVTNTNETPFALSLSNTTIDEADEAQEVGGFMTLDPDNGDTFSYALISGTGDTDNAEFEISGATLRTAGLINFEAGATRSILVRVTDGGGLTFDQTFTINIEEVVVEPLREFTTNTPGADVKNVFSPNGDGVNETWVIEDLLDNPINEVKVFAQGGKLIYSKVNYRNDWDGTFKNEPVPDGTYYYEINIYNGDRIIKGFLTIIRNR
ncbi:MAG: BspA family leucine-rich repeat surface protein [Roseivirga sp.]|nr:BspA family leucine-rich repeat surface protein [Roseivirga sp.]